MTLEPACTPRDFRKVLYTVPKCSDAIGNRGSNRYALPLHWHSNRTATLHMTSSFTLPPNNPDHRWICPPLFLGLIYPAPRKPPTNRLRCLTSKCISIIAALYVENGSHTLRTWPNTKKYIIVAVRSVVRRSARPGLCSRSV